MKAVMTINPTGFTSRVDDLFEVPQPHTVWREVKSGRLLRVVDVRLSAGRPRDVLPGPSWRDYVTAISWSRSSFWFDSEGRAQTKSRHTTIRLCDWLQPGRFVCLGRLEPGEMALWQDSEIIDTRRALPERFWEMP